MFVHPWDIAAAIAGWLKEQINYPNKKKPEKKGAQIKRNEQDREKEK